MTEILKIQFPHISGDISTYTVFFRNKNTNALLDAGGSVITEISTNLWTCSTSDRTPCVDYWARVYSGTTETAANLVYDGLIHANTDTVDAPIGPTVHVVRGIVGAVVPATTTTLTPSKLAPIGVAAGQFVGRILVFDNDTPTIALRGQASAITANTGAALPLITVDALTTAPASGDSFSIM